MVVDGAYRVDALVGAGGMAQVYRAVDLASGDVVALKVIREAFRGNPEFQRRFRREFQICSGVQHPNVVRLLRLGSLPDGSWYYAMEYLPWPSLADVLEQAAPLPPARLRRLLAQAAEGLAAVHAQGVVHRDLKPGNMLVSPGDRLVLVDFGLALDDALTRMTATGTLLGTPYYMAPELLGAEPPDQRSDVWALGVVAYEGLTGRRPFEAHDLARLFEEIARGRPTPASSLVPGLDPAWDALVSRCLSPVSGERLATARQFLQALPGSSPPSFSSRPWPAVSRPTAAPPSARRRSLLALGGVFALLVAGVVVPALRRPSACRASAVDVVADAGCLLVTWTTDVACPSVVTLEASSVPVSVCEPTPVTSHAVLVSPLPEGREVRFRLLFPDGSATLPRSVATLSARPVGLVAGPAGEPGGLRVAVACPAGVAAAFVVRRAGAPDLALDASRDPRGLWTARLRGALEEVRGLALHLRCRDGRERELDLRSLLREEVAAAQQPLLTLDGAALTASVAAAAARGRPALRASLEERVAALGLPEAWARLCSRAPLLFGTGLLSLHERLQARRAFHHGMSVEGWGRIHELEPPVRFEPRPWLGDYGADDSGGPAPDAAVDLLRGRRPSLGRTLVAAAERLSFVADLDPARRVRAARLVATLEPYRRWCVAVRLNEVGELWLPETGHAPAPGLPVTVRQRLPPELFAPGRNQVTLVAQAFLDFPSTYDSVLDALRLEVWYDRPRSAEHPD